LKSEFADLTESPSSTGGMTPHLFHLPPSLPEESRAFKKKARRGIDSGSSSPSPSSDLGQVSATSPLVGVIVDELHPYFDPDRADCAADPRHVNIEAITLILHHLRAWLQDLSNIKYLHNDPEKDTRFAMLYHSLFDSFAAIGYHTLVPSSAPAVMPPPSSLTPKKGKAAKTPLPPPPPRPMAPCSVLVTSAAGAAGGGASIEHSGTTCDPLHIGL